MRPLNGSGAVLALSFWCHTLKVPWSWTPRVYLGGWLMTAVLAGTYALALRRRSRRVGLTRRDRWAAVWFGSGVVLFWVASDWPLATLGGAYLLSAHVVIYMLYTFGAAPLLLVGTPRWMFEAILERTRTAGAVAALATPWIAGLQINAVLVLTHLPPVVDTLRASQLGSFVLDLAWMASAIVAWLPVASPRRTDRIASPIYTCVYLFLAFQLFPMLPGSLITFSGLPVYRVYELAPRIGTWSAISDQQLAGAMMAMGCTPVVWTLIGVIFIRATDDSEDRRRHDVYDTATGLWLRADGTTATTATPEAVGVTTASTNGSAKGSLNGSFRSPLDDGGAG